MNNTNNKQQSQANDIEGTHSPDNKTSDKTMDKTTLEEVYIQQSEFGQAAKDVLTDNTSIGKQIIKLQKNGELPSSPSVQKLIQDLNNIKQAFDVDLQIGDRSPKSNDTFQISLETIKRALNAYDKPSDIADLKSIFNPAIISTALGLSMLLPSEVFSQTMQTVEPLIEGSGVSSFENLIPILIILGALIASGLAVWALKKLKIKLPFGGKGFEKEVLKVFSEYEKAKKEDPVSAKVGALKKKLFAMMMGELPVDMDSALMIAGVDIKSEKDLKNALKYKKIADEAIIKALNDLKDDLQIPNGVDLDAINNLNDNSLNLLKKHILALKKLYDEIFDEWQKHNKSLGGKTDYLQHQLHLEKKKLDYIIKYLELLQKKWLILVQSAKFDAISKLPLSTTLSSEDTLLKEIFDLQKQLTDLLNQHMSGAPVTGLQGKIKALDDSLDTKETEAAVANIPGFSTDNNIELNDEFKDIQLMLFDYGIYTDIKGINYNLKSINYKIDLESGMKVQIWVNDDNEIKMNFTMNGQLIDSFDLTPGTDGLYIVQPHKSLEAYILEKTADTTLKTVKESVLCPPEAEPKLKEISQKAKSVYNKIESNAMGLFGDKIEIDDSALDEQSMRVHKEYFENKPLTSVRFILTEHYWKKALDKLSQNVNVPKHPVPFYFQSEAKTHQTVNQPMIRFNLTTTTAKTATVYVSANETYRAMAGEVRIYLPSGKNFSEAEIKEILSKAAVSLGIQDHMIPVTPEARHKYQEKLKNINKGLEAPANSVTPVYSEYEADKFVQQAVEKLKKKGLHSVYHQFSLDALESIFQTKKLLSTNTRWSKGILNSGMSSASDMANGGGKSVFTRIHTKESAKAGNWYNSHNPAIVVRPEILIRMDCYCYASDKFGSKEPGTFEQRVSPEKLIDQMNSYYTTSHEIMFNDAIDIEPHSIAYIVYDNPKEVIDRLRKIGITKIGGKPVEKAVITQEQFKKITL